MAPVHMPDGWGEAPSHPLGFKFCTVCGTPSVRMRQLDGVNYYCTKPDCRTARKARDKRLASRTLQ